MIHVIERYTRSSKIASFDQIRPEKRGAGTRPAPLEYDSFRHARPRRPRPGLDVVGAAAAITAAANLALDLHGDAPLLDVDGLNERTVGALIERAD